MKGARLDVLMVERGLAASREQAKELVLAGQVTVNGQVASRPAAGVAPGAALALVAPLPYVSRGGYKLARALDVFGVDPGGLVAADVGASTGGFTDCLLQRGARRVYAIDVGYGQLAWSLRQDERVVVMERTNARHLESLPELIALATIDVAFISLLLILPQVKRWLTDDGSAVALVKPQFEAGREQVGKGGVVRDPAVHRAVLQGVLSRAETEGWAVRGVTVSPITGPKGNVEFLTWLARESAPAALGTQTLIDAAMSEALAANAMRDAKGGGLSG